MTRAIEAIDAALTFVRICEIQNALKSNLSEDDYKVMTEKVGPGLDNIEALMKAKTSNYARMDVVRFVWKGMIDRGKDDFEICAFLAGAVDWVKAKTVKP